MGGLTTVEAGADSTASVISDAIRMRPPILLLGLLTSDDMAEVALYAGDCVMDLWI